MSSKKSSSEFRAKSKRTKVVPSQEQMMEVLRQLQQKVLGSAALNGGFDTLLFKIDKIEENQSQMGAKVDLIHEAIYNPDDGLYARVKDVELVKEKAMLVEKLERDIVAIQHRYTLDEKLGEKDASLSEEQSKLVVAHESQIKELVEFKTRITAITKWFLVTAGGAIIAGLIKVIYEFLQGHITLH